MEASQLRQIANHRHDKSIILLSSAVDQTLRVLLPLDLLCEIRGLPENSIKVARWAGLYGLYAVSLNQKQQNQELQSITSHLHFLSLIVVFYRKTAYDRESFAPKKEDGARLMVGHPLVDAFDRYKNLRFL
jgi:hypothetical protein